MTTTGRRAAARLRFTLIAPLLAAWVGTSAEASAHQLYFDYGAHAESIDAFELPDITVSRALYSELGCPSRPVWLSFQAVEGDKLSFRLGVPMIPALSKERPALALLGPGLPPAGELPWPAPSGLGAQRFTTDQVLRPKVFREPTTNTASWLLLDQRRTLPATGTYYLVAWSPAGHRVRLWVAVGAQDEDGPSNVDDPEESLRAFHAAATAPDLAASCGGARVPPPPPRAPGPAPTVAAPRSGGCFHASGSTGGSVAAAPSVLLAAACVRLRRRRASPFSCTPDRATQAS